MIHDWWKTTHGRLVLQSEASMPAALLKLDITEITLLNRQTSTAQTAKEQCSE